jgi:nucleotide-binding universal stress UspA family protein
MKIVCATDFTPRGQSATQVAVDLARRTGGWVELVHVLPVPTADLLALAADAGAQEAEVQADVEARLKLTCDLLSTSDVPVTFHVCEGEVAPSLVARARQIAADLIVTGSHGRSALRRLLLGSAGEGTVRLADRPTLVVPPGVERLGALDGARKLSVIVAYDGRPASAGALAFVRGLRAHIHCDVTFVRLYWAIEEIQRLGLAGPRDLFEPDAEIVADLDRTLRLAVGVLPGTGATSFAIKPAWGEPASTIVEFAHARKSDLVIVGAESRRGLARLIHPAVATRLAREVTGVPVVFVPASEAPASAPAEVPSLFTILAPTDLSPAGNRAIPFAYGLLAHGGVVELCHVHERALANPAYAYDRTEGKLTDLERARLEHQLRALVPSDAEARGITTHVTVIDGGGAAEAIIQAAERLVVDAIVLGSHGKGGALRSLLGSVSGEVVRESRRPVLIVPSPRA